jgi:cell division protease FtsH
MVVEYGMSAKFGPLAFDTKRGPVFLDGTTSGAKEYSEETARAIDEEVARITRDTYARVQDILARRRDDLERLAQRLLKTEVLEGEELQQLLYGAPSAPQSAPAAAATA